MGTNIIQPLITDFLGNFSVKRAEKQYIKQPDGIDKYVLPGWAPAAPFITKQDRITTFGSCFGRVIVEYLKHPDLHYKVTPMTKEEEVLPLVDNGFRFVSVPLIYQHFRWAWENTGMIWDRWVNPSGIGIDLEILRQRTRDVLNDTHLFIFSLGLSEVWRNKQSGLVSFGPIPKIDLDSTNMEFHIMSCTETKESIQDLIRLTHKHKPDAVIVFTLSPIPLQSTFRPISSITANCVSKSIIRAALDEVLRENEADPLLYYWPSYEIIQEMPVEDKWQADGWHPYRHHSDEIVRLFRKYFIKD